MVAFVPLHPIPYDIELDQLDETYRRATELDVGAFAAWIRKNKELSLLSIGSGGSACAAEAAAFLHETVTGRLAKAGRQMDLYQLRSNATGTAGLYVTAGGSHSDSLKSCQVLAGLPFEWAVFSGTMDAPGPAEAAAHGLAVYQYDLLPEVHGWVAVNSLLAQVVVLVRAYTAAFPDAIPELPATLGECLPASAASVRGLVSGFAGELGDVLGADRLMLLHTAETRPAAVDLDSKFAEGGLGELCVSDLRDFAHGRYQSMLETKRTSAVLALCSAESEPLTRAMVELIPDEIPHKVVRIEPLGLAGELVSGVVVALALAGAIGVARGRAPGWGSSGTFGDLMYDMNPLRYLNVTGLSRDAATAL
jgi:hypothetical protein